MTPAKKATPAKATPTLEELTKSNLDPEVVITTPDEDYVNVGDPVKPEEDSFLVPSDEDHVHTWVEDQDQNLARKQKDAIVADPPHPAGVQVSTYVVDWAEPAQEDDKFPPVEETEEPDTEPEPGPVEE